MDQIIGVVDAYGYWPLVRQVFSHRVFRPRLGQPADEAEIAKGLAAAVKVLAALEKLMADDAFLVGPTLSLADLHLGAMLAYFVQAARRRRLAAADTRVLPHGGSSFGNGRASRQPSPDCRDRMIAETQ